jgi:hypothetical protein
MPLKLKMTRDYLVSESASYKWLIASSNKCKLPLTHHLHDTATVLCVCKTQLL